MADDLISRRAVVDILENMIFISGKDLSKSYLLQDAKERVNRIQTAFDLEKVTEQSDLIRRGEVIESVRRIIQAGLPEQAIYDEINKIPSAFNKQQTINTIEEQINIHKING